MDKDLIFSKSVELLRFPLACLIVLGHAPYIASDVSCYTGVENTIYIIVSSICALAVPVFFLISGYYFFSKIELTHFEFDVFVQKWKKRIKTLLCPYLIWNLLYLLPTFIFVLLGRLSWTAFNDYLSDLGYLHLFWDCNTQEYTTILGLTRIGAVPLDGPLWFIRDLMVFCLLAPIVYFCIRKFPISTLVVAWGGYVLDIFVPITGFSNSIFFFIVGAEMMLYKIEPIVLFQRYKWVLIIFSLLALFGAVVFYGINPSYNDCCVRLFRISTVPLIFLLTAMLIKKWSFGNIIKMSTYSFFIYAAHYYVVLQLVTPGFKKIIPTLITFSPLLTKFLIATFAIMIVVCLKRIVNYLMPNFSYYLEGGR